MKLFFWNDPYNVHLGGSMLFAVAATVDEAKMLAKRAPSYAYGDCVGRPLEYLQDIELGEPDRVVDLPCAEWHEWSE